MESKNIFDLLNQLISLVIILVFTFWVFGRLTQIEKEQVKNAKAEQVDALEQRIVEYMKEPEKWPKVRETLKR